MQVSTFGLVIDRDGDIAGLAFFVDWSKTAVLPSSIIRTLVEMERNFRYLTFLQLYLYAVEVLWLSRL